MSKTRKWFFYAIYIIAVTGLFLYIQFPSDAAKAYITGHANTVDPFLRVSLGDVNPSLPIGLRIAAVGIYWKRYLAFETGRVTVYPRYATLMRSDVEFRLSGVAYGGGLDSRLTIVKKKQVSLKTDFKNILLEQLPAVKSPLKPGLSGACSGTLSYRSKTGTSGVTNAKLTITNAAINLATLSDSPLSFTLNRIEAEVVLEEDRLQIKRCQLNGPQGNGQFDGIVYLGESKRNIELDLKGTFKANQALLTDIKSMLSKDLFTQISSGKKDLGLTIQGSLEDPTVSFNES